MSDALRTLSAEPLRRFKPYPAYKDSGVEWLGEIPAHWEVLAAGRVINGIEQGWSPVAEDRVAGPEEWAVIKLSAVSRGSFVPTEHKTLPMDLPPEARYEIRDGDFLLTRSNTPELVGEVCVVRSPPPRLMLCDLVYRLDLRRDAVAAEFLAYWFLSPDGRYQIEVEARGSSQSMVKVSQGLIRAWAVVVPPMNEQHAIAAFLDRETARIDALVAKKERLIELLQEKRTALITRAVTRGLDPTVPMKDSGVEWLGEIPAHWESGALRRFWSVVDCKHRTATYVVDGIPIVSTTEIKPGRLALSGPRRVSKTDFTDLTSGGRRPRRGDIIYSRNASLGAAAYVDTEEPFCMGQDVCLITSGRNQLYLAYLLNSPIVVGQIEGVSVGSTFERINVAQIKALAVAFPPISEQVSIAAFLDQQTARIDALIAKVRDAIDRVKELRTALISAAVTGKIDVRQEAPA